MSVARGNSSSSFHLLSLLLLLLPFLLSERADESDFPAFISALNHQLKPLKMELAHGCMEDSGERWYALVNRSPDLAARLSCSYSAAELELFNKIVSVLVSCAPDLVGRVWAVKVWGT